MFNLLILKRGRVYRTSGTSSITSWLIYAKRNEAALPYRTWCQLPKHPWAITSFRRTRIHSAESVRALNNPVAGNFAHARSGMSSYESQEHRRENFSGQQTGISHISPAQLAGSVRQSILNRLFICPILLHDRQFRNIQEHQFF